MTSHYAHRLTPLFVILILAMGCATADKNIAGVHVEETVTPAGYALVRVNGSPVAVTPVKGRLIGEKDGPQLLHNIRTVLLDRAGNVYVASAGTKRIVVFDSTGKYLRDIGRDGEGPGEYRAMQSLAWYHDTLLVLDGESQRIGKFSTDGKWVGSFPAPAATGDIQLYGLGDGAFANLNFMTSGERLRRTFTYHLMGGRTDTTLHVHRDSLVVATATGSSISCRSPGRISLYSARANAAQPIQYATPDAQLLVVMPDAYKLTFMRAPQDTARVIERALAAQTISDEEWRPELERYEEWKKKLPPGATCSSNTLDRITHNQVVRTVFYDSDAMLWVDAVTSDGRYFEQFDARGNLMKRVESVPYLQSVAPYVRGNLMVVVETDSLDIQLVRLYSIPANK